jgi:GTP cyclohydrolase I
MPRTSRSRRKNPRVAPTARGAAGSLKVPADTKLTPLPPPGEIGSHVRGILAALGEDPVREGLLKTPERVEKALRFLTKGYREDIHRLLNRVLFTVGYDEMVIIKDIDVFSLCEHHLLPFFGRAHVAYIPKGRVIGLSKIPRLVDAFARRLQVQERLTVQIAEAIQESVQPAGVAVVIEAMHFCMIMRGVQKQNSVAVTSCMLGSFRDRPQTREEFLALIRKKHDGLG